MARYCSICGEPKEAHREKMLGKISMGKGCPVTRVPDRKGVAVSRPTRLVPESEKPRRRKLSLADVKEALAKERSR